MNSYPTKRPCLWSPAPPYSPIALCLTIQAEKELSEITGTPDRGTKDRPSREVSTRRGSMLEASRATAVSEASGASNGGGEGSASVVVAVPMVSVPVEGAVLARKQSIRELHQHMVAQPASLDAVVRV